MVLCLIEKGKNFGFFGRKKSSTKVLQKFEKFRIFPKKVFFRIFYVFSHFEVKNEVPEHLR